MIVFLFHGLKAGVRETLVPCKPAPAFHTARIEQAVFGTWSRHLGYQPGLGQYHGPEPSRDGNAVFLLNDGGAIDVLADFTKRKHLPDTSALA